MFVAASSGQYTNGVDKFGRHEEPIQPEFIRLCVNGKFERVKKIPEKADEEKKKEILNTVDSNGRNALISALERFQPIDNYKHNNRYASSPTGASSTQKENVDRLFVPQRPPQLA